MNLDFSVDNAHIHIEMWVARNTQLSRNRLLASSSLLPGYFHETWSIPVILETPSQTFASQVCLEIPQWVQNIPVRRERQKNVFEQDNTKFYIHSKAG